MTYYGVTELAASFRTVRNNTIQVAKDIPEDQYGFSAAPDTRSVEKMLVHIALGPTFQLTIHQNRLDDLAKMNFGEIAARLRAEEAKPRTKNEILALLESEGEKFANYLAMLPESFLAEQVKMPAGAQPPTKSRFEMLLSPKEHEMHHRAQLMLIERMLGVVPHITRQFQERMAAQASAAAQR
jgi:uncharacterized damage-inducible protein DinB